MQVPFALYHLITVLNTGFLLATAYQFVFYAGYWGIVPVTFTALAFQGLRELASVLADPLGNDDTDIPVLDYVVEWHSTVESTVNLPRARQPRKMA